MLEDSGVEMQRQKRPRLRLPREAYQLLHRQVLERDRWHCQNCGRSDQLEVHHIRPRSRLGDDAEENLVTLCSECHRSAHLVYSHGNTNLS